MGDFVNKLKVKERTKVAKVFFKKSVRVVGDYCKKGWYKVKGGIKR